MPILRKEPVRPGAEPLVYFKGSMRELERMPLRAISSIFFPKTETAIRNKPEARFEGLSAPRDIKKAVLKGFRTPSDDAERWQSSIHVRIKGGYIQLRLRKLAGGKIAVYQHPAFHNILRGPFADSFENLKAVIGGGFHGRWRPNISRANRRNMTIYSPTKSKIKEVRGDGYQLELLVPTQGEFVEFSPPSQILRVNIWPSHKLTKRELERRKLFYRKHLGDIPFGFIRY